jgi:hypothetical protein
MQPPRRLSYVHIATVICWCFLLTVLALVGWDHVTTRGTWLLWFIPACGALLVLLSRKPWLALALYLGLR